MNHFELFGLPRRADVDLPLLEQRFRELSLELHPDRLVGADARARRVAAEKTASLNEGVKVLRDPVERAFYLLRLEGVDLSGDGLKVPMEFLEEIMTRREALDEARAGGDLDKAQAMAAQMRAARDEALGRAKVALDAHDTPAATEALSCVRYYVRFLDEVDAIEEELVG